MQKQSPLSTRPPLSICHRFLTIFVCIYRVVYSDSQRHMTQFFYMSNNITERPFQLVANVIGPMCKIAAILKIATSIISNCNNFPSHMIHQKWSHLILRSCKMIKFKEASSKKEDKKGGICH